MKSKYEELMKSTKALNEENAKLKEENNQLRLQMMSISIRLSKVEDDQESTNLYLRRECLEFHGIPVNRSENTDTIVQNIAELLDVDINEGDISKSHRLPSKRNQIPPIIAKFTNRNLRDKIYTKRKSLKSYTTADLGFSQDHKIYINESLTQKAKGIFNEVNEFKKTRNFKFIWTKYGKTYLRKDEHTEAISFPTLRDFIKFKDRYSSEDNQDK